MTPFLLFNLSPIFRKRNWTPFYLVSVSTCLYPFRGINANSLSRTRCISRFCPTPVVFVASLHLLRRLHLIGLMWGWSKRNWVQEDMPLLKTSGMKYQNGTITYYGTSSRFVKRSNKFFSQITNSQIDYQSWGLNSQCTWFSSTTHTAYSIQIWKGNQVS